MLVEIEEAWRGINGADEVRAAALNHVTTWLSDPEFAAYVPQIEGMVARRRFDALLDAFYQVIPFGTGGRRGPVGVGPNRINPWTLATSVLGHASYLRDRFPGVTPTVVIAYDVRKFQDRRGIYDPSLPSPVLGLTSRDLAELAAQVYAAVGIDTYLQPRGDRAYIATPELSFAIRHLGAHAGLNVSASHNHPDDNGGKFYNHLGGQEVPPDDEEMVRRVAEVDAVQVPSWEEAVATGHIRWIERSVHHAYVAHVAGRSLTTARATRVAFTALHGTGAGTVAEVLRATGFSVAMVPEQNEPDGDFPTVPFRAPNPEVPQALDRATAFAGPAGCDLVLATDPDADRIGASVLHAGGWRFLSGNEIATLVADHVLTHGRFEGPPLVVQTEVTTGFVARMARARGAAVIDHLLVGFKYIGDVLRRLDASGEAYGTASSTADFAVGVEESHGVLTSPYLRDKDAAGGGLALAEAASLAHERGETLVDRLHALWAQYGYVANQLVSTVMQGAAGKARINAIQAALRATPPERVGSWTVRATHDRQDVDGPFGPILSETDRASRDVLVFDLERGDERARVILRPSGTEPKNKAYVEVHGRALPPGGSLADEVARVDDAARDLAEAFVDLALGAVGLRLPPFAHGVSQLVSVEGKLAFGAALPELVRRIEAAEPYEAWLDALLRPLGADPRALVAPAVARYLASHEVRPEVASTLGAQFGRAP